MDAAALCRKAGADPEAIPAWIEEGGAGEPPPGARQEARALADDHAHTGDPARRPEHAVRSVLSRRRRVGGDLVSPECSRQREDHE